MTNLFFFLRFRGFRGRAIGVNHGGNGLLPLTDVTVSLGGIGGRALDGDETFVPWRECCFFQWGEATDRIVARALARLAPVPDDRAGPALSREEIAAVLAEGERSR